MNISQIDALSVLDKDGYPSERTLERLSGWDMLTQPLEELLSLLATNWKWGLKRTDWKDGTIKLYLATGGWSGNEEIIAALSNNYLFWSLCWDKSKRGGAYWFTISPALRRMWANAKAD